jgi:hypothetical protein
MNNVTLNKEKELFVIQSGSGYSCMGFDYLFEQLTLINSKLGRPAPRHSEKGTIEQYQQYQDSLSVVREKGGFKETWYSSKTPSQLKKVLEKCRKEETLVRVFYCGEDGKDWLEEYDMLGRIGRSTGLMKIPLLVPKGAYGGGSLLDDRIGKVVDVASGKVLYQAKNYFLPEMEIKRSGERPELPYEVFVEGKIHARFSTLGKAGAWLAYMTGETFCDPNPQDEDEWDAD